MDCIIRFSANSNTVHDTLGPPAIRKGDAMMKQTNKFTATGKRSRWALVVAAISISFLGIATQSFGQGITGSITGTVSDATGAVVSGANVTVTQVDTNASHVVTTSDSGNYTVTQLPPGRYSVRVEKAGFQSFIQKDITLSIDQVAQVNAQLGVGSQEQTIEVTSTEPVIQTESSSVGSVIDRQAIQNTPLNGRLGLMGLITLAPGVQNAGAQDQLATRGVTVAVGTGSRNAYGGLGSTLDGVSNKEVTLQRAEPEVPSLDAIAQFKVLTTGAPAEFNEPAQIIVVSASGTNQYHGGLLEYNRSRGMGAKTYFGGAKPRPAYQRNEYGANLSGPISIPGLYNGRDKSFFFAAYEGFHLTQAFNDNTQGPSLLERQGIFTEFTGPILDPLTGTPFTNNTIPTGRQNTVSLQLMKLLWPTPTQSGIGVNTFELVPNKSHATRFSLRLDQKLGNNDQLRFTLLRAFYGPSPTNGASSLQGGNSQDGEHNMNMIAGWTHTFSPTLLLDTYGSFFHLPIFRTPQNYKTDFSSIIPGLGPELIQGAPQISISNIQSVSESGSKDLEQAAQLTSTITKVLSKHTIKAGFTYLYDNHWNDSASSPQRGQFTFTNNYSGNAFANFLLGYPTSTAKPLPNNFITRNISSQYGFFVQDDWKVRPNLTFNAGLRYDLQWFRDNPYSGVQSLFVPSLKEVVVFANAYPSSAIPNFLTSVPITLAPAVNLPTSLFAYLGQDKNNIAPRLGFAYEMVPNTVLRGAFGIYYNLIPASYIGSPFSNLPFVSSETYSNSAGTPSFTMYNPFSATGAFTANPSVLAQAPTVTPYTEQYNLALEHQFAKGWDVRLGYVGQHNLKQNNYGGPGNYAPNINLPAQVVPIKSGSAQTTYNYQPFSSIAYNMDPIFHSSMNSLQIGAHKQYSHGIAFGAEYQWTRVLGTENIQNPSGATPNDSYGPVGGITPQVLTVNYSYLLPFGKGKALLANSGGFVDKVVSGWVISGISDFQTGQPFSVTSNPGSYKDSSGTTWTNLANGRADRVPGVPLYPAHKTLTQWFNTAAFQVPTNAAGIQGGAYGNSGYNMLRGPRYQDWDINLQKNILFRERYNVQLRADSFNVFNHPNFNPPNANISNSSTFGKITAISGTPSYEPRTVEFAAKFNF